MKREELPQDISALINTTRELYYVKDEQGKYCTDLSTGWTIKANALDNAWESINEQINLAKELVLQGEKSPIFYFMHKNIMNISLLKDYTGFCKFSIKRHFKPRVFNLLSDTKLNKYATVFNISLDELKNPKL